MNSKLLLIWRWKVLLAVLGMIAILGIGIGVATSFIVRNSHERILTDSIANSLSVEKAKFTISYGQSSDKIGLKNVKLNGLYDRSIGYTADADVTSSHGSYEVSIKGRVALDRAANAYYIYDTVDDGKSTDQRYRMTADAQRAVQDNFKTKWLLVDADGLGQRNSCILGLLQTAQHNPLVARTFIDAVVRSNAVEVRPSEPSSGTRMIYAVTVPSGKTDEFMRVLKKSELYTKAVKCNEDGADSLMKVIKLATFHIDVDKSQRQVKAIDIETKESSGTNKVMIQMASDESVKVSIPKDAQPMPSAK